MPAGGFKVFVDGEVLPASDINDYLMQGILVFADEATRDSSIAGPDHGMFAFTQDENKLWYYDGTNWQEYRPADADFSNTPTGSYTDGDGQDWKYISFTADGSLTVTKAGYAEIMVLGGGAGGMTANNGEVAGGGGGGLRWGGFTVPVATHTVTVGAGGASQSNGNPSSFGTILKVGGGEAGLAANTGNFAATRAGGGGGAGGATFGSAGNSAGAGAGGTLYGSNNYDGLSLSFTGSAVTYGRGGFAGSTATANRGEGGAGNAAGSSGIVIVRVRV
jgi:hypothetical protein